MCTSNVEKVKIKTECAFALAATVKIGQRLQYQNSASCTICLFFARFSFWRFRLFCYTNSVCLTFLYNFAFGSVKTWVFTVCSFELNLPIKSLSQFKNSYFLLGEHFRSRRFCIEKDSVQFSAFYSLCKTINSKISTIGTAISTMSFFNITFFHHSIVLSIFPTSLDCSEKLHFKNEWNREFEGYDPKNS